MRAHGGTLATGAQVSAIKRQGSGWQVAAGGETCAAPLVINAAGAWADKVAQMAGVTPIGIERAPPNGDFLCRAG